MQKRSTTHSSQPPPSESVRAGQSEDIRISRRSLVHKGLSTALGRADCRVRACRSGILRKNWLNKDTHASHARPSEDPTTHGARPPGKAFTTLETAARPALQAGTRHLTPARLAFAPRLPLSGYPPPVLGLMLATTEIACILACGILGWGLGMRPSCRSSQDFAGDSAPWPSS